MYKLFPVLIIITSCLGCRKEENTPVFLSSLEQEVLTQVNYHRNELGLSSLESNAFLNSLARSHSANMALGKIPFGHDGFSVRVEKIIKTLGNGSVGENVAMSSDDVFYTVNSLWLSSSDHKANIEGDWKFSGVGVCKGSDGYYYYTQIFFKPQ